MNPYLKQYKQTQINTTPKEQILLMLYDGAVRFLHLAKEGLAEKNIEKTHNNITKVQKIITEFESSLDLENGGEFAKNLFGLYEFMSMNLTKANIKKDEAALDIVIKHMTELRDTWRQAINNFRAQGNSLAEMDLSDRYTAKSSSISSDDDSDDEDDDDDDDMGGYLV